MQDPVNGSHDQRMRDPLLSYYPNIPMSQAVDPNFSFDFLSTFNQLPQTQDLFTSVGQPDFPMGTAGQTGQQQFSMPSGAGIHYPSSNFIPQPFVPLPDGNGRSSLSPATVELDYQALSQDINTLSNQLFSNSSLLGTMPGSNPTNSVGANVVPGTNGVLELGLDSGMDAGWLSFMRECGIVPRETPANET